MFAPTERWLSAFTDATRIVMRRWGCPPNACIEAACIGVGVARRFGYVATPVPVAVRVQVQNTAILVPGPPGTRPSRDGFAGHLVLHFAGDVVVDLTADQFHRPDWGILVPGPITVPGCAREHLAGGVEFELPTGAAVAWQEMVGNVAWRSLPAWTQSSAVPIRLVEAELHRRLDTRKRKSRVSRARDR